MAHKKQRRQTENIYNRYTYIKPCVHHNSDILIIHCTNFQQTVSDANLHYSFFAHENVQSSLIVFLHSTICKVPKAKPKPIPRGNTIVPDEEGCWLGKEHVVREARQ